MDYCRGRILRIAGIDLSQHEWSDTVKPTYKYAIVELGNNVATEPTFVKSLKGLSRVVSRIKASNPVARLEYFTLDFKKLRLK